MAISNYSELQSEIAAWIHRANLTDRIPAFVSLCEADIARDLRVWQMENEVTLSATEAVDYVALPSRCFAIKSVYIGGSHPRELRRLSLPALNHKYIGASSNTPAEYSLQEGNIVLAPTPSADIDVVVTYWASPVPLATTSTNDILTNYPDVYLYGSLKHGYRYMRNLERAQEAEASYLKAVASANKSSRKLRASGTTSTRTNMTRRAMP